VSLFAQSHFTTMISPFCSNPTNITIITLAIFGQLHITVGSPAHGYYCGVYFE
jgi:hypothetical protein